MACSDPSQFRSLVAPHCTDLRSDQCSRALVKAGGAYGPGCLDLSIVASPELGMPPYRNYVCPGATGALARLCGPTRVTAGTSASTSASTGTGASSGGSYGALAAGLGVTTTALGLTTLGAVGIGRHLIKQKELTIADLDSQRAEAMAATDYLAYSGKRLNAQYQKLGKEYNPQDDPHLTMTFKQELRYGAPSTSEEDRALLGTHYVQDRGHFGV